MIITGQKYSIAWCGGIALDNTYDAVMFIHKKGDKTFHYPVNLDAPIGECLRKFEKLIEEKFTPPPRTEPVSRVSGSLGGG